MDNFLQAGHRQLIDAHAGGLAQAWQRAAQDAERHPAAPRAPRAAASHRRSLAFAGAASALLLCVALLILLPRAGGGPASQAAMAVGDAAVALASTAPTPAGIADARLPLPPAQAPVQR